MMLASFFATCTPNAMRQLSMLSFKIKPRSRFSGDTCFYLLRLGASDCAVPYAITAERFCICLPFSAIRFNKISRRRRRSYFSPRAGQEVLISHSFERSAPPYDSGVRGPRELRERVGRVEGAVAQ